MTLSKAVVSGLCAWGMSLPALAQAPATTITIGDLPPLGGDRVNRLATVTITENRPDAIRDGTFILYFPDNPDQTVEFQEGTTVTGPVTARVATNYLIINVDSDDSVAETIVIRPEAYFRTRLPFAPAFELQDGDPMRMSPTGVLDGIVMNRFELGTLGDIIGLEIGFEEDVQVGETIVRDIVTAEGENTGPYTAETLDPAIAAAVVDGNTVRVTGLTPGTTHAVVHDSLGRQDMMVVNVLPAPGGALTEPPAPQEPEESGPEIAMPVTPTTPGPGIVPAAPEIPEETVNPAPMPESSPSPAPMPATDGQGGNGATAAVELPLLPTPIVMGGGTSTAVITAGATTDGSNFRGSFANGERVNIAGEILPETAQVNSQGEVFVAVQVTDATGNRTWFHRGDNGWERWNGSLGSLNAIRGGPLAAAERLEIFEGALQPGRYEIYLGYMAAGDALIYSGEPLVVEVSE